MAKGYLIVEVSDVTDPAAYERYRTKAGPVLEKYGGKFLIRSTNSGHFLTREGANHIVPKCESLEGGWLPPLFAVCEFPTFEQARAFYFSADYQEAVAQRIACSESKAILVEGI